MYYILHVYSRAAADTTCDRNRSEMIMFGRQMEFMGI